MYRNSPTGNPPTQRQIQDKLNLSSSCIPNHHIKQLKKKGLLIGKGRNMRLANPDDMRMDNRIEELGLRITMWADEQFGKDRSWMGAAKHLSREVTELICADTHENIVEEHADCFMLLLDSALKYGITIPELVIAAEAKFEVNLTRKWKKGEDGINEHVREPV